MSTSSEKYLISSVIRNGDVKTATGYGLAASMFHSYPEEWDWIEKFYLKHRKAPSKVAFRTQFPDFNLKAVDDTSHFAEEVKRGHARHMMMTTMKDVADLLADGKVDDAVQLGYVNLISIAGAVGHHSDGDIIASFEDVLEDAKSRKLRVDTSGISGVRTGFDTIDDRTGGPGPGDYWTIAARLGEGKSWTMQKMATAAILAGHTVQYDALEQTKAQVAFRCHAFLSSGMGEQLFRTADLMQGRNFDPKEYKKFLRDLKQNIKGKLHIADTSRGKVGLMTVASQIERNQPDIVFIDYITLMDKKGGEWQDIATLSGGIKSLAGQYTLPIVAAAQLNRERGLGKEPPGPEALAQSDSIGQDSDVVITMKQTSPSTMMMKTAKDRNNSAGYKVYCHFAPGEGVFEEVSFDRWQDLKDMDADAAVADK